MKKLIFRFINDHKTGVKIFEVLFFALYKIDVG